MFQELFISCLAGLRVLFIGDSITAAYNLPPEERMPALVAEELGVDAVNLGVPFSTSMDWLPWETTEQFCPRNGGCWGQLVTRQLPADALVLWLGTNDASGVWEKQGPTPWTEFLGNIIEMVEAFDGPVFLITPPFLYESGFFIAIRSSLYRERALWIAKNYRRVHLGADAYSILKHPDDFIDTVHPNAQGLAKVAKEVSKSISSVVARSRICTSGRRALSPEFIRR